MIHTYTHPPKSTLLTFAFFVNNVAALDSSFTFPVHCNNSCECLVLMGSQDTFVQVREGRNSKWHRKMGELR